MLRWLYGILDIDYINVVIDEEDGKLIGYTVFSDKEIKEVKSNYSVYEMKRDMRIFERFDCIAISQGKIIYPY